MRKKILLFLFIIFSFFCNTLKVYAKDNITVESTKNEDFVNVIFNVGDEEVYGLYGELEYQVDGFQFDSCIGESNTEVSYSAKDNNIVVIAENLTPIKNSKIVTCKFKQLIDTSSIKIKKIDTSNSKVLKREEGSVNEIVTTKNTLENISIIPIILAIILIGGGTFIILRTKKGKALLLLIMIIPFGVYAEEYVEKDLDDLRNLLLTKIEYKDDNKKYDIDEDKVLSINDLIKLKMEVNKPKIKLETTTKGEAEYHTEAKTNVTIDSNYTYKLYYCIDSKDCTPKTEYKMGDDDKVTISLPNNENAQKVCIKAVNSVGLSTTKCDSKTYKVDNKVPSFSFKNSSVSYTILNTHDNTYDTLLNVKDTSYGVGGGNIVCSTASAIGSHTIKCIATGKNGLKTEKTYTLVIIQKTLKLLFVGNSKTYKNDIPGKVKSIAESNGYSVTVTSVTEGGKTLQWTFENKASELSAVSGYDFLIMQEQYDALTSSDVTTYKNGAQKVLNLVKVKNPSIQPYIRSIWTHGKEENGNWYFDNTLFSQAKTNSANVAQSIGATLIYDGNAFKEIDNSHRSILILEDETGHQTVAGAYLSAACIYKRVFGKSPVGTTYKAGLSDNVANTLLSVANSVG